MSSSFRDGVFTWAARLAGRPLDEEVVGSGTMREPGGTVCGKGGWHVVYGTVESVC